MEELLSLIANVGFPIAVAVYLLIRFEAKLGELTRAISELRECIITLPGRIYPGTQGDVFVVSSSSFNDINAHST